ncbi:MAG: hypothetical protein EHM64_14495 [Ignavibacteriae bacterium]|nr:MAG: hypothetical protein EHM64_14495 [Ignavibacteriota bacterium]
MTDHSSPQVNLLDLLTFLLRWRKFILTVVISVTVAVSIIAFLLTPKYRSTAIVKSTERNTQGLGSLVASKLASLGGIGGFTMNIGETPGELHILILQSRWMSERLIQKFNLRAVYKMEDASAEELIKAANSHTRFELDPHTQTVIIKAEDKNPELSYAMTVFLTDELDHRNQELRSEAAKREREFISNRLDVCKHTLAQLEDSLTIFQKQTGMVNPDEQVKATLQAVSILEAQKLALKSELEFNALLFHGQSDMQSYVSHRIASIESTLTSMMRSRKSDHDADFMFNLEESPSIGMAFLRLTRDIQIQQLLVAYLIQQYEQAKLEEHRDTPTLMRLEPPVVATERFWPKRSLMALAAAFASLIFAVTIAGIIEFFRIAWQDEHHPQHQRLLLLKRQLKRERV